MSNGTCGIGNYFTIKIDIGIFIVRFVANQIKKSSVHTPHTRLSPR